RNAVKLGVATARPSALDANATAVVRYAPDDDDAFLAELDRALLGGGQASETTEALAGLLRDGGEDIVIVWGERIGASAAARLLRIAQRLGLDRLGAGLLQIPTGANGRGLREAGAVPDAGPGYELLDQAGRGAADIGEALAAGELTALHLFQTDPVRDQPDRALWEDAMHSAALVVAHANVLTEGLREHANVIFPAESHAEKEGTVVHPDGRLQRLRIAVAHPGEVRPGWWVLAEVARLVGTDLGVERSADAFEQLVADVPVYAGLTLDAIAGHGIRWPERAQVAAFDASHKEPLGLPPAPVPVTTPAPSPHPDGDAVFRLGTYRPVWAAPECEISPALKFLVPEQAVELSPEDAQRLGIGDGDGVQVAANGTRLQVTAAIRTGVPAGSAFLAEGIATDSANALTEPLIEVHKA
ncbi:MAG: molybdopterin-dependent oxidoreductase, partial [Solirubrobacteraceae bacterium]